MPHKFKFDQLSTSVRGSARDSLQLFWHVSRPFGARRIRTMQCVARKIGKQLNSTIYEAGLISKRFKENLQASCKILSPMSGNHHDRATFVGAGGSCTYSRSVEMVASVDKPLLSNFLAVSTTAGEKFLL
jgi:hypothetical protein